MSSSHKFSERRQYVSSIFDELGKIYRPHNNNLTRAMTWAREITPENMTDRELSYELFTKIYNLIFRGVSMYICKFFYDKCFWDYTF